MADKDFKKAWDEWIASAEGKSCGELHTLANDQFLANRLYKAFSAAWAAKPAIEYAPYESTVIAISTEAGYLALHENIQEGWEPLLHWADEVGSHMVLRKLRI